MVAVKQRVLASGLPEDCEIAYVMPEHRALFALHVDPTVRARTAGSTASCARRSTSAASALLESEQRRLTEELGTALQRYETALRGSHVTVFTQDREPALHLDQQSDVRTRRSMRSSAGPTTTILPRGEPRSRSSR